MASITFVEGAWRALIRRKGHKPISKRFPLKKDAAEWARSIEAQIDSGKAPRVAAEARTVAQLIQKYRELRKAVRPVLDTSTEHYTLNQLEATLGHHRASALTVDDILAWAKERRNTGAGAYTVNCDLSKLGTVLRYTADSMPDAIGAARPKLAHLGLIGGGGMRQRRPTEDEIARIVAWLDEKKGQVWGLLVDFTIATALRRGEITRLRWDDLDREKRMVLVRDRKDPRKKKGNDQWVPLLGKAWPMIEALDLIRDDGEQRIFPWNEQTISKYFREACVALGIPDLHFHDLRHEGTSRLFEEGFEIQEVALVTGHKDWRHLRRYTQLKPESLHARGPRREK